MTIEYDEFDYELSRYFRETYKSDSRIANDILNLVDLIGIQDIQLLHECMTNIYENKITPQVVSIFEKNENEIIEKIRDASKIKMEDYAYISLSDAYTTYQVCSYIFNKETPPTNEDIGFAMDSFDRIYKDIGIVYSHIVSDLNVFNKIQSLGGRTRAKKYDTYKSEIFREWEKGAFHSYSRCARDFSSKFDLNPKTIELWLSKKYSKS
ncbi:hypothetical protein ACN94T_002700 [Acinetobacter baumannii]|nr:hypothetical protein [Acinetobacter baumannii]EKU4294918.1 hypothetical protein [Acinetobacter baumannii]EKU4349783.1 hypothetical protein [Acinetobacter baumannii]EKU7976392.1 hypothetical protein [Acinetobacter baumannii]EKV6377588.1 hypothetical protein [Acinetobacter baumannii]